MSLSFLTNLDFLKERNESEQVEPTPEVSLQPSMRDLVEQMAEAVVDDPGSVSVEEAAEEDSTIFTVNVAPDNAGRVIGRKGRVANAMRTILRAVAGKEGRRVYLRIEPDERLGGDHPESVDQPESEEDLDSPAPDSW